MKAWQQTLILLPLTVGLTTGYLMIEKSFGQANSSLIVQQTLKIPNIYSDPQTDQTLAIRGYDPVAYFTKGMPTKGKSSFQYQWKGATWYFFSQENLNLFKSNPEKYSPQYGGYCAKGLSEGNLVSTVPEAWTIVDNKLYLNYSLDVQKQWLEDVSGNIAKANQKWPSILNTAKTVYYDTVGVIKYD